MDKKNVTPDNNRDEFDDVLEIMRKRRTKPEYPAASINPINDENHPVKTPSELKPTAAPRSTVPHGKPVIPSSAAPSKEASESEKKTEAPKTVLKGALAKTIVIPVSDSPSKENSVSHLKGTAITSGISSGNSTDSSKTESASAPKSSEKADASEKPQVTSFSPESTTINGTRIKSTMPLKKPAADDLHSADSTTANVNIPSAAAKPVPASTDVAAHDAVSSPAPGASSGDASGAVPGDDDVKIADSPADIKKSEPISGNGRTVEIKLSDVSIPKNTAASSAASEHTADGTKDMGKTISMPVPPVTKTPDATIVNIPPIKPPTSAIRTDATSKAASSDRKMSSSESAPISKPTSSPIHPSAKGSAPSSEGEAVSLDDFSDSTATKKSAASEKDSVKVTFLGSVWFGIIKIILYLVFVIAVASGLAAAVIFVANDVFAFVKESEIVAEIPVDANAIEITSIINEADIISKVGDTELHVKVMKNNKKKLQDTLNTTSVLQPLRDAGITDIEIKNNTEFTINIPENTDISVVSKLLDTVNATELTTEMQIVVDIPEDATTEEVGEILKEAGVIKYAKIFKIYAEYRIDKRSYLTGEYLSGKHIVNPMMNYDKLLDTLSDYERDTSGTVRITIPEGLTVNETIDLLVEKGVGKRSDYTEALQEFDYDYRFVKDLTADKLSEYRFDTDISYRLEGYLFPDTYDFYYNENPVSVIDKFLANFDKKFEEAYYERAKELGMTVDEVITLASMIEKEGNNPTDYYYISSVFHNRLNSSEYPYLNSDATIQYALSKRTGLYDIDTGLVHPYNTYNNRGLPPGSICNPGIQAIDAALYPENTNYYYFYTKKNGETVFSRTYNEHQSVVNADKSAG